MNTMEQLVKTVRNVFGERATIDTDNSGQIIIYTDLMSDPADNTVLVDFKEGKG